MWIFFISTKKKIKKLFLGIYLDMKIFKEYDIIVIRIQSRAALNAAENRNTSILVQRQRNHTYIQIIKWWREKLKKNDNGKMLFVNNKKKAVVFFVFSNMDNNFSF